MSDEDATLIMDLYRALRLCLSALQRPDMPASLERAGAIKAAQDAIAKTKTQEGRR